MAKGSYSIIEDLSEEEKYLWCILSDQSGLDLAEFCWIDEGQEHDLPNEDGETGKDNSPSSFCFRAWPYQWAWFRTFAHHQIDQCARALSVFTPICTPDGWTTMGELAVGDVIYDGQGSPTTVTAVSPEMQGDCYEVSFDDHTSIVADADHLWETWTKRDRVARNPNRRGHPKPAIRTTLQIKETLSVGHENNHSVDVAGTLQAPDAHLLLDPYYLGFWLGDGNTGTSEITTADEYVLKELERRGFDIVERASQLHYGVAFPYPHNRKTESVQARLRQIGVLGNKHVPMEYLRASESQRRDLLAGLVDSDGHMQSNGSCEITQKVKAVADGLLELLRSLGEKPRISVKRAFCNGKDCGNVYRLTWRPRSNPAYLPRKADNFVPLTIKKFALGQRRIVNVQPISTRPVRCIQVANPSGMFLAGAGMIPTHNSVGKSLSIKLRAFAFPFNHPGQEMVITAPELNHLEPITDLVEYQFYACRLGQMMLAGGRSGITHRPFKMNFKNGARIMGRIPQKDGKGVKGIHPVWLEMDEAQDYPRPGWTELNETLKQGNPNHVWRAHGVTRGVRDDFFDATKQGSGWKVHRFTAMHRPYPYWSDQERENKIKLYHGRDNADYRRNILGEHGDEASPIFNLHRFMACVDDDQESTYNADEYTHFELIDSWLRESGSTLLQELDLPVAHTAGKYKTFWVGMDVGWTNHPSEILVFAEERLTQAEYRHAKTTAELGRRKAVPPTIDIPRLKLLTRITMTRIAEPDQEDAIMQVIQHYRPKAFSFDATGGGLPMFQNIQRQLEKPEFAYTKTIVKGYNFSGKILVDFDKTIEVSEWATKEEIIKETGIKRNTVDYATDQLRVLIDQGRFWLPWDQELLNEFGGQTYKITKTALDSYGRREYSLGKFHALDAARMMALGWAQYGIEEFVKQDDQKPIFDVFMG